MLIGNYFKNINSKFKNHKFSCLSFNSAKCKKNYIFFAVKGNNNDGNRYISHAIKNGAKTIISNNNFEGKKNDILFVKSSNVKLIMKLQIKFIKNKNLIAVTGTNGKSSIANFYLQIVKLNKSGINWNFKNSNSSNKKI